MMRQVEVQRDLPLIWIEIGRRIPRYLRNVSKFTREMHPQFNQYLIHDSEVRIDSCQTIPVSQINKSNATKRFESIKVPVMFKDELFWRNSTLRFFYLHDFMVQNDLEQAIHLESDCLILRTEFLQKLAFEGKSKIYFPEFSRKTASGAVMLVNSINSLREFLDFTIDAVSQKWANDMDLLGQFSKKIRSENLPSDFLHQSKEVFDAGNITPFFLGTDARNSRFPFSTRGKSDLRSLIENSADVINPNSWHLEKHGGHLRIEFKREDGREFELQNLHIHSKRVPHNFYLFFRKLRKGFNGNRDFTWYLGSFDFVVFLERIASIIYRRILRKKKFKVFNFR